MKLQVEAYGITKDILQGRKQTIEAENINTVGEFREYIFGKYPELKELTSLSFALNESYVEEDTALQPMDTIVLIPPVSGG